MVQQTRFAHLLHHPSPERERRRREHTDAIRIKHILKEHRLHQEAAL